ncbi:MAG: phosphopantetheine-binding protein [Campylobacteraceae bacterium]|nr:phosphopantetheine-binding protein [Campylobacteraceae bacterium]
MITTDDLKEKIIIGLGLEDIGIDEIEDDSPLFGEEGLGLDSVDAIELTLIIEKEFGVKIKDMGESENIFSTPNTLVAFINSELEASK